MTKLVIASNNKAMRTLDRSVNRSLMSFFEKLNAEGSAQELQIEPLKDSADPRVRIGRVDQQHGAILFRLDDRWNDTTHVYVGTWPHDEAIRLGQRSTLRVNPVNGALEGIIGELDGSSDRRKRVVIPDPNGELARALAHTTAPQSHLEGLNITFEDLTERLGVDPAVAELAMAAPNKDTLVQAAEQGLEWEQSAILALAAGMDVDDVRAHHGFDDRPIDTSKSEDEQILEALERPASKMQFVYIEDNEALRRIIEDGDFAALSSASTWRRTIAARSVSPVAQAPGRPWWPFIELGGWQNRTRMHESS